MIYTNDTFLNILKCLTKINLKIKNNVKLTKPDMRNIKTMKTILGKRIMIKVFSTDEKASEYCDWLNQRYPTCFASWDKPRGFDKFVVHWIKPYNLKES